MITLFYSYAREDEAFRDRLEAHLAPLKRQGIIATWHDRLIDPGHDFAQAISQHLEEADIILLLISADFINSDYCYDQEMTRALEKHAQGDARVIPVIVRPCDWESMPFGKLQAIPTDGKPISSFPDQDTAFFEVAQAIRRVSRAI